MNDPRIGRDLELLARGWQYDSAAGRYRRGDDGDWQSVSAARVQAGLDAPPPPPPPPVQVTNLVLQTHEVLFEGGGVQRVLTARLDATAQVRVRLPSGGAFTVETPFTADEAAALQVLLDQVAARIAIEIRQL